MMRLTWLVGPPGAGKSTFMTRQREYSRSVELNAMMAPLVEPLRLRKGVLRANGLLVQAIRHVELHPDHASLPPLLVVAGMVREEDLFPLGALEEVLIMLPERRRWERQLRERPAGPWSNGYDDYSYAEQWYQCFEDWLSRGLQLRRVEAAFEEALVGRVPS